MSGDDEARDLVAVTLVWRGRVGIFKRGERSGSDPGRWRCVHDALGADDDAVAAAARILHAAPGLVVRELSVLRAGPVLRLADDRGRDRRIHTVLARTDQRRLQLGKEHVAHRWVRREQLARFDGQVTWLRPVVDAVLADRQPASVAPVDRQPVTA